MFEQINKRVPGFCLSNKRITSIYTSTLGTTSYSQYRSVTGFCAGQVPTALDFIRNYFKKNVGKDTRCSERIQREIGCGLKTNNRDICFLWSKRRKKIRGGVTQQNDQLEQNQLQNRLTHVSDKSISKNRGGSLQLVEHQYQPDNFWSPLPQFYSLSKKLQELPLVRYWSQQISL